MRDISELSVEKWDEAERKAHLEKLRKQDLKRDPEKIKKELQEAVERRLKLNGKGRN